MADASLSSDLSALDAGLSSYRQEVTQAADKKAASAQPLVDTAAAIGEKEVARAEDFAASQQPFTMPTPTDQIGSVMNGAPWLFALASLGGKAAKVNGLAMIQGLNGMSSGIIAGDEEALDTAYKRYQSEFDKWKSRADQQFRIYQELATAYSRADDGKMRALTAAMQMTNDAADMKLQVDDPTRYWDVKSKVEDSHAKLIDAYAKMKAASGGGFGDDKIRALLGALTERGISLPTGFKSRQQMQATLQGVIDRNPDKTPDQLADMIGAGQIAFGAEKKETQTAAAVAGRVAVAANEIKQMAPIVLQASAKVSRGDFVPITKLLQAGEASVSDPDLKRLRISINSLLNAYDLLAARGGTDKDKRAEVRGLLTAADSPEALAAGIKIFMQEADAAGKAAAAAEKPTPAAKTVNFEDLP